MSDKWSYIFKNSIRDFVLMAMITISLISILVVSNIGNENSAYLIEQQELNKKKDIEDNKQAEIAVSNIERKLSHLDRDTDKINHTTTQLKIIMNRILLFEEQIHNENIIKFQKLDKLIDNLAEGINNSKISHDDIRHQLEKNIDGTLGEINKKLDHDVETKLTEIYTKIETLLNSTK